MWSSRKYDPARLGRTWSRLPLELLQSLRFEGGPEGLQNGFQLARHGGPRSTKAEPEWEDSAGRCPVAGCHQPRATRA